MPDAPAATPATTTAKRSVLLIDDHPIVRQGLAQLINQEDDLTVIAEATGAREALDLLQGGGAPPDLIIVDISLEDRSGIELIKDIRVIDSKVPILALSMHDESLYAERALRAGAKGYVMKQEATETVMDAIRKVLSGNIFLSEQMSARLVNQFVGSKPGKDDSPLGRLSDREMEIFTMIGRGVGTREIAQRLFLSIKTVEAHREHIKDKLKLKNGTELMRMAVQYVLESSRSESEA